MALIVVLLDSCAHILGGQPTGNIIMFGFARIQQTHNLNEAAHATAGVAMLDSGANDFAILATIQDLVTTMQGAELMGNVEIIKQVMQADDFFKHSEFSFHRGFFEL
jgi:hypothetical protein